MTSIEFSNGKITCESMGAVFTWVCHDIPLSETSRRLVFSENGTPIKLSFDVVDLTSERTAVEMLASTESQHKLMAQVIAQTIPPNEVEHFVDEVQSKGGEFLIIIGYKSGDNYGDISGRYTTPLEIVESKMHKDYGAILVVSVD